MIFEDLLFAPSFVYSYFYPSTMGFTRPNDGRTGLCIKLCSALVIIIEKGTAKKLYLTSVHTWNCVTLTHINCFFMNKCKAKRHKT